MLFVLLLWLWSGTQSYRSRVENSEYILCFVTQYFILFYFILFISPCFYGNMDNKFQLSDDADGKFFSFGRGMNVVRGHLQSERSVGMDVGASPVLPARDRDSGLGQDLVGSPTEQMSQGGPHHSTPSGGNDTLHQLTDMITRLGSQIGESIAATLMSGGAVGGASHTDVPAYHVGDTQHSIHESHAQPNSVVNALGENTPINVIVKADKEPVIFRGDTTDKYTVTEWIELMKSYLKKQKCDVSSQTEVVMGRLMGKARDVVKIGLRSNPSLSSGTPDVIYSMLTQYFSHTSSCLPLQDFYSTMPNQRENPVDYWIRLNKAADIAEEGLKRQGRHAENMGSEIAKMFVKHCPDSEFASVFKYKQIHEWTTMEIQERIDEYQRERVSSMKAGVSKTHATALICHKAHTETRNACDTDTPSANSLPPQALSPSSALCQNQQLSLSPAPQTHQPYLTSLAQQQPQTVSSLPQYQRLPPQPALQSQPPSGLQPGSDVLLGEMVSMLRELLARVQTGGQRPAARRGGRQVRNQTQPETSCRVCNDENHTTESHCRLNRLCFTCFRPGHAQRSCPTRPSVRDNVQGN